MKINNIDKDLLPAAKSVDLSGSFVYYVVKDGEVVYVGQTTNLPARMTEHNCYYSPCDFRVHKIDDETNLTDLEFFQILKHRPRRNKTLPTPSFFMCKSAVISDNKEQMEVHRKTSGLYDEGNPDYVFFVFGKVFRYWIKHSIKAKWVEPDFSEVDTGCIM